MKMCTSYLTCREILELDFKIIDADKNGAIDYIELTKGIEVTIMT